MFCTDVRTDRDFCFIQHWLIGFYNRSGKCLLRGTNWFLIYSRLSFVFKRLTTRPKNQPHTLPTILLCGNKFRPWTRVIFRPWYKNRMYTEAKYNIDMYNGSYTSRDGSYWDKMKANIHCIGPRSNFPHPSTNNFYLSSHKLWKWQLSWSQKSLKNFFAEFRKQKLLLILNKWFIQTSHKKF